MHKKGYGFYTNVTIADVEIIWYNYTRKVVALQRKKGK